MILYNICEKLFSEVFFLMFLNILLYLFLLISLYCKILIKTKIETWKMLLFFKFVITSGFPISVLNSNLETHILKLLHLLNTIYLINSLTSSLEYFSTLFPKTSPQKWETIRILNIL